MSDIVTMVDIAVAARFAIIKPTLRQREGGYVYSGRRTLPGDLGWRFRQGLSIQRHESGGIGWRPYAELPTEIAAGQHDALIERTWHDAASAEHWYSYEKDWGGRDAIQEYLAEDGIDTPEEDEEEEP